MKMLRRWPWECFAEVEVGSIRIVNGHEPKAYSGGGIKWVESGFSYLIWARQE